MQLIVDSVRPVAIRRPSKGTVTIVNQSAVDVYFDPDYNRLAASLQGTTPSGTKIAASGGQLQWPDFAGTLYFRAITTTTLEIQP